MHDSASLLAPEKNTPRNGGRAYLRGLCEHSFVLVLFCTVAQVPTSLALQQLPLEQRRPMPFGVSNGFSKRKRRRVASPADLDVPAVEEPPRPAQTKRLTSSERYGLFARLAWLT